MKINNIADKKVSSHTVKPLFSNEINETFTLIDKGVTLSNDDYHFHC